MIRRYSPFVTVVRRCSLLVSPLFAVMRPWPPSFAVIRRQSSANLVVQCCDVNDVPRLCNGVFAGLCAGGHCETRGTWLCRGPDCLPGNRAVRTRASGDKALYTSCLLPLCNPHPAFRPICREQVIQQQKTNNQQPTANNHQRNKGQPTNRQPTTNIQHPRTDIENRTTKNQKSNKQQMTPTTNNPKATTKNRQPKARTTTDNQRPTTTNQHPRPGGKGNVRPYDPMLGIMGKLEI